MGGERLHSPIRRPAPRLGLVRRSPRTQTPNADWALRLYGRLGALRPIHIGAHAKPVASAAGHWRKPHASGGPGGNQSRFPGGRAREGVRVLGSLPRSRHHNGPDYRWPDHDLLRLAMGFLDKSSGLRDAGLRDASGDPGIARSRSEGARSRWYRDVQFRTVLPDLGID